MSDEALQAKILSYRARHNLSQGKFAKLCNVTPQTICNIENGVQKPSKLTRRKISDVIEKEE